MKSSVCINSKYFTISRIVCALAILVFGAGCNFFKSTNNANTANITSDAIILNRSTAESSENSEEEQKDTYTPLREVTLDEIESLFSDEDCFYYRVTESERFKFFFWGSNDEGEIIPEHVIMKDKSIDNKYFILHVQGVWDMMYDNNNNYLFIGVRNSLMNDERNLEDYKRQFEKDVSNFALDYNTTSDEVKNHLWEGGNMCGGTCPTVTTLERINLNDLSVDKTFLFGGEEISIDGGNVRFAQYTHDTGTYSCWVKIIPHEKDCNNLDIKVFEMDPVTLEVKGESSENTVGAVNNVYESFKSCTEDNLFLEMKRELK